MPLAVIDHDDAELKLKNKWRIRTLRISVFLIMCCLAAALGAASFKLLRDIEISNFNSSFKSLVTQLGTSIQVGLGNKFVAARLLETIYQAAVQNGYAGKLPYLTLPGYEKIAGEIIKLASLRALSWNPLVNATTRAPYEAWAKKAIFQQTNITSIIKTVNTTAYTYGVYNRTLSGGKIRTKTIISGGDPRYNTWLFPCWQIAPLISNAGAVWHDPHASLGSRYETIEKALKADGGGGVTDIIQLLQDSFYRPSSILYTPVFSLPPHRAVIGFSAAVFTWDQILQNALPSYLKRIDLVLTSKTQVSTFSINQGVLSVSDRGDRHDPAYSSYGESVELDVSLYSKVEITDFTIKIYPSADFISQYLTDVPFRVCISVVFMIIFAMLIIIFYDYVIQKRETKLINMAEEADDRTKDVVALLPAHLAQSTGADLKALSIALQSQLASHPVHKAILDGLPDEFIMHLLGEYGATAKDKVDGRTAFDFIVQRDDVSEALGGEGDSKAVGEAVVTLILEMFLPVDNVSKLLLRPKDHGCMWPTAVQYDRYTSSIVTILNKFPLLISELANVQDAEGRHVINIASPENKREILAFSLFFRRYELSSFSRPLHKSDTCVVHLAIDHEDRKRAVALKFMCRRDQFDKEINVRAEGGFSAEYVVGILRIHDPDDDGLFGVEVSRKGFAQTPYCIVMEAGERSLLDILEKENIAGRDWSFIRSAALQIAKCLAHVHDRGMVHGDIKNHNILRMGHGLKLIDLDTSAASDGTDYACNKFSSGFIPPECVYATEVMVCVRSRQCRNMLQSEEYSSSFEQGDGAYGEDTAPTSTRRRSVRARNDSIPDAGTLGKVDPRRGSQGQNVHDASSAAGQHAVAADEVMVEVGEAGEGEHRLVNMHLTMLDFDLVPVHPSQDVWSFGVVLYSLAAQCSLFHCDFNGNISGDDDMRDLEHWSPSCKAHKLSLVTDKYAHNLMSQLLTRDPLKRPSMKNVLNHPFLSGRQVTRLSTEKAEFDVFISYRVNSERIFAEALYERLTRAGLRVWFDKKSIKPGEDWEESFCRGLVKSSVFVPIFSRHAINHPTDPKCSVLHIHPDSPHADNLLVEFRLALELHERGLIEKVLPVLIGDEVPVQSALTTSNKSLESIDTMCFGEYTFSGVNPDHPDLASLENVVSTAIEKKVTAQLEVHNLGSPYTDNVSVAKIMRGITRFQGVLVIGDASAALDGKVVPAITSMCTLKNEDIDDSNPHTQNMRHTKSSHSQLGLFPRSAHYQGDNRSRVSSSCCDSGTVTPELKRSISPNQSDVIAALMNV